MKKPLLTVIMATYRHEKYLPEAIESVLNQEFRDWEFIIVNDASPDNSEAVIHHYLARDPRIRYFKNEKNLGAVKSANFALLQASGEWIYWFGSDDRLFPRYFSTMLELLKRHPDYLIASSDYGHFRDGSEAIKTRKVIRSPVKEHLLIPKEKIYQVCRKTLFLVGCSTLIFHKSLLSKYGYFDVEANYASDLIWASYVILHEGIIYLPQTLTAMRFPEYKRRFSLKIKFRRADQLIQGMIRNKRIWDSFLEADLLGKIIRYKQCAIFLKPKYWSLIFPVFLQKMKFYLFYLSCKHELSLRSELSKDCSCQKS